MNLFTPAQTAILNQAKLIIEEAMSTYDALVIASPSVVVDFLKCAYAEETSEKFGIMFLDNKNKLIKFEKMFSGTINAAPVYPREVVKRAMELNAAGVILAHNHPSGDPTPSDADKAITNRLKAALGLLDIEVYDHVVIGCKGMYKSFAEMGLM